MLASPALRAEDKPQDKDKPSAQEQYRALVKEYSEAQQAYFKAIQGAKTAEERQNATDLMPKAEKFAPRFLELAEKHPKDPVVVDALVAAVRDWEMTAGLEGERAAEQRSSPADRNRPGPGSSGTSTSTIRTYRGPANSTAAALTGASPARAAG